MPDPILLDKELDVAIESSLAGLCQQLADAAQTAQNSLVTPKMRAKAIEQELKDHLKSVRKKSTHGMKLFLSTLPELSPEVDLESVLANLQNGFSTLDSIETLTAFSARVLQGATWSQLLGFSASTTEALYKAAKSVFDQGRYEDSVAMFTLLIIFDPTQSAFWLGLGHAQFHLGRFDEAIKAFDGAASCEPATLWPHLYTANCFEAKKDFQGALEALERAEKLYRESGEQDRELGSALREKVVFAKNRL